MSKILIPQKAINRIKSFSSRKMERFFLNGIYFHYRKEKKDVVLVATDGRKLVIYKPFESNVDEFESFILPSKDILKITGYNKVVVDLNNQKISFCHKDVVSVDPEYVFENGLIKKFTPIDGIFPKYEEITPNKKELTGNKSVKIDFSLLKDIPNLKCNIYLNKDSVAPHVVTASNVEEGEYVFIIMSMNGAENKIYPDWIITKK